MLKDGKIFTFNLLSKFIRGEINQRGIIMVTPVNRVAYAYLQESRPEPQDKNNEPTINGRRNILKKLLNKFLKFSNSTN